MFSRTAECVLEESATLDKSRPSTVTWTENAEVRANQAQRSEYKVRTTKIKILISK
jgi:hypothetical protein